MPPPPPLSPQNREPTNGPELPSASAAAIINEEANDNNNKNSSRKAKKMSATVAPHKELIFLSAPLDNGAMLEDDDGGGGFGMETKREQHSPSLTAVKAEQETVTGNGVAMGPAFCIGGGPGQDDQLMGGQGQLDQTDIYRELILRHLIADISGTCTKLGLPTELVIWTADDCRRWVVEMCAQFQLDIPPTAAFAGLNGRKMLALSVDEFQARFPNGGDTLHAQLQLWKTAFESCVQPSATAQQQQFSIHHQQQEQCRSQHHGGFGYAQQQQTGASPPNEWLTSSPINDGFGSASTCSSASQYSCSNSNSSAANQQSVQQFPGSEHQHSHYFATPNGFSSASNSAYGPSKFGLSAVNNGHQQPCLRLGTIGNSSSSDCSAVESVSSSSSGQPDDSSSVAEEDFLTGNGASADVSGQQQHFFLPSTHQHAVVNNFCLQLQPGEHQFSQMFSQPQQLSNNNGHHTTTAMIKQQQAHHHQQHNLQQRLPSHGTGGTIHLWHFIRELLDQPKEYGGCVRWVDRGEGTFKIESSHHLARYWGIRKNRAAMNYDKLSRSLRQYYKKGIIQKPEKKQRLVYKFLPPYNQ